MHGTPQSFRKISVIIPAYNCEKTLKNTLDSIRSQDYENIEIIIIDDGSVDGTKRIIQSYLALDSRVRAAFQENAGPSAARNTGLEMATGELIMFMDADDKMESNVLSYLVQKIQQNESDLLITGIRKEYKSVKGNVCEDGIRPPYNIYNTSEEIWDKVIDMLKSGILNSLCAKVYRKKIIDFFSIKMDIRLDMGEDLQFNLEYLEHCESLLTIPYISYIYLIENSYLTNKYRANMFQSRSLSIDLLRNHLEMHKININIIYFLYLKLMIAENMQAQEHGIKYKLRKKNIQNLYSNKNIIYAIHYYQPEGMLGKIILLVVKRNIPFFFDLFTWACVKIRQLHIGKINRISV